MLDCKLPHSAIAAFDSEIKDGLKRGMWWLATADDLNYSGPVNYIILTEDYKETVCATIPVCISCITGMLHIKMTALKC